MAKVLMSDDSSDSEAGGAELPTTDFKVNADFAKRFEHNKKREELQRLEEKLGKSSKKRKRNGSLSESTSSDESSSSSEDEDDEGEFATNMLDSEIQATLNAIRSKDPRVYDGRTTFYTEFDSNEQPQKLQKEKPMYLKDYHRQNLLNGGNADEEQPLSYNQQQDQLKRSVIGEMHAVAESSDEEGSQSEDGFLVKKQKTPAVQEQPKLDLENADRDPETFLSNFMAARAWIPNEKSALQPFESDDEDEEQRAEEFEEAYNMRFEDPEKSNETLRSHARDLAAKYSVRRDDKNARRKKRDAEKEKKEEEKQQLKEEKARLKKLRMEQIEEKIKRVKRAAGIKSSDLRPEDWAHFIDNDWDDAKWEEEMQRRFNDDYYADQDFASDESDRESTKARAKKPIFDDDIDIKDIVPDFEDEDAAHFSLTDEEESAPKKKHKQIKEEKKREAKRERRIIEQLVDDQIQMGLEHSVPNAKKTAGFRYRETSPTSFGLTSRDILLAEDSQLNQYAGLKKLADFREADKKQRDRRKLGKKARLRQWRKDTFGNEEGLQDANLVPTESQNPVSDAEINGDGGVDIRSSGKKKRRRKNKKVDGEAARA